MANGKFSVCQIHISLNLPIELNCTMTLIELYYEIEFILNIKLFKIHIYDAEQATWFYTESKIHD